MAVSRMKKLSAVIPADRTDEVLRALQRLRCAGVERLDTPPDAPPDGAAIGAIADEAKNIPPLKEFADMEARVLKMDKARLERYAFCNAFAVLHGLYYDKTIGNDFIRCLHEGADMPAKYPDVYWWIYKKAYESYVHGHVAEFGLKFRDFTLISDDDAKLDKLILVLEGFLTPILPAELAPCASSSGIIGDNR